MRRREVIAGIAGGAAWPLEVAAQQSARPTIGYLGSLSPELFTSRLRAFHQGLRETGYVEDRNVAIEYRWAEGQYERIPALIAELVRRQVAVIATPGSTPAALAAKAATTTIPIVFLTGTDPVEAGLVSSLNRPGGNLTGVTVFSLELGPKRVQLLHELIPAATSIALLVNHQPSFCRGATDWPAARRAAPRAYGSCLARKCAPRLRRGICYPEPIACQCAGDWR